MNYNPMLICDFYKISHRVQYPAGTEYVYSTWTPRQSLKAGIDQVVSFGQQAFVMKYLIEYFEATFFSQPIETVLAEYTRIISKTLGVQSPETQHIEALHSLGYLPLKVCAIPEGTVVPVRTPIATVENTHPEFFWLTNYIETLMSAECWLPSTSATIANQYRKILDRYAKETGGDMFFVNFQGHDFSMRGMGGIHSSALSGVGHLTSFFGTDTIPAIMFAEKYYGADVDKELVGTSVNATEHSVMCANGQDEKAVFLRLLTEVHPTGILSVVSDTWDFWNIVGVLLPSLKETIMSRDGKLVIRPDSGDPVKILTGEAGHENEWARKGLIQSLWDIFGGTVNEEGFRVLDQHIGAIYGDSITLERCETICRNLQEQGFASTNVVYGIGSFTYQYNTRDTFGFAMKATSCTINGVQHDLFKAPKTDSGVKKSQKGRVAVIREDDGTISTFEGIDSIEGNLLEPIFQDGKLLRHTKFSEIRERLASYRARGKN